MNNGPGLSWRVLNRKDTDQVTQLEARCFERPWSLAMVANELADSASFACGFAHAGLIQEPDELSSTGQEPSQTRVGELVAYALFKLSLDVADMSRFAVFPALHRQGIGSNLLRRAVNHLASVGASEIFLEVRSHNRPAIALYLSHGFEQVGRRSSYYPDGTDALVFRRFATSQKPTIPSAT